MPRRPRRNASWFAAPPPAFQRAISKALLDAQRERTVEYAGPDTEFPGTQFGRAICLARFPQLLASLFACLLIVPARLLQKSWG